MPGPLAAMVRAKFPGAYDDLSDQELEAAVTSKYPGAYDDLMQGGGEEPRMMASHGPEAEPNIGTKVRQAMYDASPLPLFEKERLPGTLAAVAGGVAAPFTGGMSLVPALATVGAASGGAAALGRGGVSLAEGNSLPTALEDAAEAGLVHGAIGSIGRIPVGDAMKGAGTRLYTGLLKAKQGVKDSFGGSKAIAETALKERAPISLSGLQRITDRLGESRGKALEMVRTAEDAGAPTIDAAEIIREYKPIIGTLRRRVDIGQPSQLGAVGERGRSIVRTTERGGGLRLTRGQELKEEAQDAASGAYRAHQQGTVKQLSADDMLNEATAKGLQKSIEARVPGVGAQNARTRELLGVKRALEDATEREANTAGIGGAKDFAALLAGGMGMAAGGPGAAAIAGGAMRALATPSIGSKAAIALYRAGQLPLNQLMRILSTEANLAVSTPSDATAQSPHPIR